MQNPPPPPAAESAMPATRRHANWTPIISEFYDGEKTPGEMGAPLNLIPSYDRLSARAYEQQLKSDLIKIITGKFFKYVIGSGLKLQVEPNMVVLQTENIPKFNLDDFRERVEARFSVYADSKYSDIKREGDLHDKALEAYKTAFLSGDCLVVNHVNELSSPSIQIIDGRSVRTPYFDQAMMKAAEARGNEIKHGIEINPKGTHIAYYVHTHDKNNPLGKFTRIEARGSKTGRLMAYLLYGEKHKESDIRGIPVITQILEKVEKLDRYTEATVGSAEERAKIVFAIEHSKDSDGENPLVEKMRQAAGKKANAAPETAGYAEGAKTAALVAQTTQKQTFNMPIGAQLKALSSTNEFQYDAFAKAVFSYICASVDIPPEVAMQLYEQNYSSSRAAIMAWQHIVKVHRKRFSKKFYKPFYRLWFETEIVKNKITAPGFLAAMRGSEFMTIEAYLNCRFVGANMPHIDPLKEVKAIREMLGSDNKDPLISREQAAEALDAGDWRKNYEKYLKEDDLIPEPEPQPEPVSTQPQNPSQNAE